MKWITGASALIMTESPLLTFICMACVSNIPIVVLEQNLTNSEGHRELGPCLHPCQYKLAHKLPFVTHRAASVKAVRLVCMPFFLSLRGSDKLRESLLHTAVSTVLIS